MEGVRTGRERVKSQYCRTPFTNPMKHSIKLKEQTFYRKRKRNRKKVPEGVKVDPIIDMTVLPP